MAGLSFATDHGFGLFKNFGFLRTRFEDTPSYGALTVSLFYYSIKINIEILLAK